MFRSLFVVLLWSLPSVLSNEHQSLAQHKDTAKHRTPFPVNHEDAPIIVVAVADIGSIGVPPQGPPSISTISTPTQPPKKSTAAPRPTQSSSTTAHSQLPVSQPTQPASSRSTSKPVSATITTRSISLPAGTPPPAGGGGRGDPEPSETQSLPPTPSTTSSAPKGSSAPQEIFPDNDECQADSNCGSGSSCCFFNDFANVCLPTNQCSVKGACRFAGERGSCGALGGDQCRENSDCDANKPICCSFTDIGNICIKPKLCTAGQCLSTAGNDVGTCDNPQDDLTGSSASQCQDDSDCAGKKVCCDFGGAEPNQCIRPSACVHDSCRSTSGRYGGCDAD